MSEPEPPSGRQTRISAGTTAAALVEVGGALRALTVDGHDVLDGYAEDEMCTGARGQPLLPWPNRLGDGRYTFDGVEYQAPLTEPAKHNAIHGYTRFLNWDLAESTADTATYRLVLHPQPGYEFTLALEVGYRVEPGGLEVTTRATNLGDRTAPYAAGAHPYLTAGTATIDSCRLQAPGTTQLLVDDRGLPTGRRPVAGTEVDFRSAREIGDVQIDNAFADLARDSDGRWWVHLTDPGSDRVVSLWGDEAYGYVELFTGDSLPQEDKRRTGLGVEPMTCAPNAFATGEGLIRLAPGESVRASWGIRVG